MKKRWGIFWLALWGGAVAAGVMWRAAIWFGVVGTVGFVFFAVWWTLYYHGIIYRQIIDELIIQKGIVFRKKYHIPRVNILWVTRIGLWLGAGRRAALCTVIRTAGGSFVIFADYSTDG